MPSVLWMNSLADLQHSYLLLIWNLSYEIGKSPGRDRYPFDLGDRHPSDLGGCPVIIQKVNEKNLYFLCFRHTKNKKIVKDCKGTSLLFSWHWIWSKKYWKRLEKWLMKRSPFHPLLEYKAIEGRALIKPIDVFWFLFSPLWPISQGLYRQHRAGPQKESLQVALWRGKLYPKAENNITKKWKRNFKKLQFQRESSCSLSTFEEIHSVCIMLNLVLENIASGLL